MSYIRKQIGLRVRDCRSGAKESTVTDIICIHRIRNCDSVVVVQENTHTL